jgi:uncharacterized protein (DUF1810 family)
MSLQRFLDAQTPNWHRIVAELHSGVKVADWMLFVFPQLRGIGESAAARYYGIADLGEAQAYLRHPVLGERLRECTWAATQHDAWPASRLFGLRDARVFCASMTLFHEAAPHEALFCIALDAFFAGEPDHETLQRIDAAASPPA